MRLLAIRAARLCLDVAQKREYKRLCALPNGQANEEWQNYYKLSPGTGILSSLDADFKLESRFVLTKKFSDGSGSDA